MSAVQPPPDRALDGAALLDAGFVEEHLAPAVGIPLAACRPRYARFKPGTSLLVQYELVFAGGVQAWAHAWQYADGRGARTWHSASYARLVERARRRHPEPFAAHAAFDSTLGVLFELSPVDSRLPALVRASSRRKLRRMLAEARGDGPGSKLGEPTLVRHKPGRKALIRFPRSTGAIYVKVHADGRDAIRAEVADAVALAGVPTARPLAHLPSLGAVAYPEAEGTRLVDLRGSADYAGQLGAVAETLAALGRVTPPAALHGTRAHGRSAGIGALVPSLAGRADAAARRIAAALGDRDDPVVLAHGDFYDDQLLVSDEGALVLDLDEARAAPALVDVGNFLAHLSARTPGGDGLRDGFLDACDRAGIDVRGAALYEAAALLELATGPFRRLEPNWPDGVERILGLAERRLREYRRERGAVAFDERLPQLRSLCRPPHAAETLTRALGRPVSVASVAVVKHRPGRRCTLSYRLDDGRRLFVKTYASERAPRVFETTRRVRDGGVPGPLPLGWDAEASVVVLGALDGEPVLPRILAGDEHVGVAAAELLHGLHDSTVALNVRHDLADELAPLADRVARLATAAPQLRDAAERCLRLAVAGGERPWTWRYRPVHRDFYESQLLVSEGGLAVLDLDDAAMSEPAVDVANFTAHLRLLALRPGVRARAVQRVVRAFVRRYRELDADLSPALVSFLEATTLLRLAEIHLRSGERLSAELLRRSTRLLERC